MLKRVKGIYTIYVHFIFSIYINQKDWQNKLIPLTLNILEQHFLEDCVLHCPRKSCSGILHDGNLRVLGTHSADCHIHYLSTPSQLSLSALSQLSLSSLSALSQLSLSQLPLSSLSAHSQLTLSKLRILHQPKILSLVTKENIALFLTFYIVKYCLILDFLHSEILPYS